MTSTGFDLPVAFCTSGSWQVSGLHMCTQFYQTTHVETHKDVVLLFVANGKLALSLLVALDESLELLDGFGVQD